MARQNPDDPALCTLTQSPALEPYHDPVPVHRLVQIGTCDVDVLVLPGRGFRRHEPEAARVGVHPADEQVHLVGQSVPVAPNLHQRPGGDQRPQPALERGTLIPRHPQRLLQLAGCRRVVDPLPYPIE